MSKSIGVRWWVKLRLGFLMLESIKCSGAIWPMATRCSKNWKSGLSRWFVCPFLAFYLFLYVWICGYYAFLGRDAVFSSTWIVHEFTEFSDLGCSFCGWKVEFGLIVYEFVIRDVSCSVKKLNLVGIDKTMLNKDLN